MEARLMLGLDRASLPLQVIVPMAFRTAGAKTLTINRLDTVKVRVQRVNMGSMEIQDIERLPQLVGDQRPVCNPTIHTHEAITDLGLLRRAICLLLPVTIQIWPLRGAHAHAHERTSSVVAASQAALRCGQSSTSESETCRPSPGCVRRAA